MAWSMMAAVAMHAVALASWPARPGGLSLNDDTPPEAGLESAQPEWLFMDQALAAAPQEGEGAGAPRPKQGAGNAAQERGIQVADAEPVPEGISADLRDRLVRSTSFAPSVADGDGLGGLVRHSRSDDEGAALRGSSLGGLSTTDYESLQELSALDLERLSAIRPEVALESSSARVQVRNPGQVKDFILRHGASFDDRSARTGAASVAIWISAAGSVEWAEIVLSSGRREWDDLALELFNDVVTFRPARLQGVATPMSAIFTVDFPW
jgi:TonB family protein